MYHEELQVKPQGFQDVHHVGSTKPLDASTNITFVFYQSSPFIHPNKFAEQVGVSPGVVGGWIDNGYIPTMKVGKYRLINISALIAQCRDDIKFTKGGE